MGVPDEVLGVHRQDVDLEGGRRSVVAVSDLEAFCRRTRDCPRVGFASPGGSTAGSSGRLLHGDERGLTET